VHGDTICPTLSSPMNAQAPRAPPSRCNLAVLSHAEYVPTLTAAAALCVKAALSGLVTLTFNLESGVWVTCDVGYLCGVCAKLCLPRPLCSRVRPDVRDRQTDVRQTDVRQKHRLMPHLLGAGHNNLDLVSTYFHYNGVSDIYCTTSP